MASFSNVSFSSASDNVRSQIRHSLFNAGTNSMDIFTRRSHYTVYEYTQGGHVLVNHLLSESDAQHFVGEFTSSTSKVYILKTSCIDVYEPQTDTENHVESSNTTTNSLVDYDSEDDSDYNPENDHSSSEDEDLTEDEDVSDDESTEDIDLSDMFFYKYGKGFLLTPTSNHELFGSKYLLDGWWMSKHKSWFFKAEFEDTLLDHGAILVTEKTSKASKSSKTSKTSKTSKSSKTSKASSNDLSSMTFTKYGKGFILTTDESDSRYGTKYILSDLSDGGFWNSNANGWFFKKSQYDLLIELGAKYIKSEDNYETSDTSLTIKPNIKPYGKGYFLKADSNFVYTGEEMNYYENGWYIPNKKGWFFKKDAAKTFMSKYNM